MAIGPLAKRISGNGCLASMLGVIAAALSMPESAARESGWEMGG